jgi:oxaloacetate decarboxylase gamma subunit
LWLFLNIFIPLRGLFKLESMNEGFSTALMLFAVGMITVFTILALIVILGNLLISLVNKYIPEAKIKAVVQRATQGAIDPRKMAAIVSVVDIVTEGQAKVTSITKAE